MQIAQPDLEIISNASDKSIRKGPTIEFEDV